MRRTMMVTAAAGLLGIAAGPAALAQSPSPGYDAAPLRVAVPEEGFAATFPADWVMEAVGGESFAVSSDRSTRCLTTGEWFDEPIADPAAALDRVAAIYPDFSDDGALPVVETAEVDLPSGRAVRFIIDLSLHPEYDASDAEGARYLTTYILADDLRFLFLSCWAPERPGDDWLSLAETLEFLPAADD